MKRADRRWVLGTGLAALCLAACSPLATRVPGEAPAPRRGGNNPFITVSGRRFYLRGRPYVFVGANYWPAASMAAAPQGLETLQANLDRLQSLGIDNLRVLVAAPEGLDRLLVELARRDMRAVLVLTDFTDWAGAMAQFYRLPAAQQWYRQKAAALVERTNAITGQAYIEDPTIMAWQLAHEPRPGSEREGRAFFADYQQWIAESAAFIKSLDNNHLVSSGSEGALGNLEDIELYLQAHDRPQIDYLTFHLMSAPETPVPGSNFAASPATAPQGTAASPSLAARLARSRAAILQHLQVAESLDKPLVLEAFGAAGPGGSASGNPAGDRDRFFAEIYEVLANQIKLGAPLGGSNFWRWSPGSDPFGISEADEALLSIIAEHARRLGRTGR